MLVAGSRIERLSQGYEPYEIPLLYPAYKGTLMQTFSFNVESK